MPVKILDFPQPDKLAHGTHLFSAVVSRRFKITGFSDTGDLLRNMFGGAAMGFGGVLAFGCTIGQAITGVSTLALGSMLSFVSIILGGVIGIKYLEYRLLKDA